MLNLEQRDDWILNYMTLNNLIEKLGKYNISYMIIIKKISGKSSINNTIHFENCKKIIILNLNLINYILAIFQKIFQMKSSLIIN